MRNELRLQAGLLDNSQLATIRAAADARELAMIEVLFTTRRCEAARLTWGCLDLITGMMSIPRGKGGTSDWTLMLPSAKAALEVWKAQASQTGDADYVFPVPGSGTPARPYTPGGFAKIIQALLTRAGLWSRGMGCAHRFRRSFATSFIRANEGQLPQLQRLMRHKDIRTTAGYLYLQPADLTAQMARVKL